MQYMFHLDLLFFSSYKIYVAEEDNFYIDFRDSETTFKKSVNFSFTLINYYRFPSFFDSVHKMPKLHEVSLPMTIK